MAIATFAAGCFWGVEHIFLKHFSPNKEILSTQVGYTGGNPSNPTYHHVCSGTTNHAEAVRIEFDPTKVSYADLVGMSFPPFPSLSYLCKEFFYRTHDPTTVNRQGRDKGSRKYQKGFILSSCNFILFQEYRSAIFTHSEEQEIIAKRITEEVQEKHFTPKGQLCAQHLDTSVTHHHAHDHCRRKHLLRDEDRHSDSPRC